MRILPDYSLCNLPPFESHEQRHSEPRTIVSGSDQPLTVVRGSEAIATYTRYADDLTFSFPGDHPGSVHRLLWFVRKIVEDEGYDLHIKKKLHIRRRHDRQQVTGLVVNERVNLPRAVRRRLRAIEHHLRTGRTATLTQAQLAGWKALQTMIAKQSG